jgi:hypothetical protein
VFAKFTLYRGKADQITDTPSGGDLAKNGEAITYALEQLPLAVRTEYTNWQKYCLPKFTAGNLDTDKKQNDYFATYYAQIVGILFKNPPEAENCSENGNQPNPVQTVPDIQPKELQPYQKQLLAAFDNYLASLSLFEAFLDKAVLAAAKPVVALEYDFNTPVSQPTTSTVKVIISKAWFQKRCPSPSKKSDVKPQEQTATATPGGPGTAPNPAKTTPCASLTSSGCINQLTATLNAGGNFYNSTPSNVPGAGAFRDAQVGTEADWALCTSASNPVGSFLGNATIGFTYYYQDQVSPSILRVASAGMPLPGISITGLSSSATQVFAKKGPINFAQVKYGLGTGKNVKFPIAFSYSNRTDLIVHRLWSAQFGVSYDLSSLFNSSASTNTSGSNANNGFH